MSDGRLAPACATVVTGMMRSGTKGGGPAPIHGAGPASFLIPPFEPGGRSLSRENRPAHRVTSPSATSPATCSDCAETLSKVSCGVWW